MRKYVIYLMTVVFVLLAVFAACKKDKEVSVTGVLLNGTAVTLAPDSTITLIATVQPDNATNKAVTWTSSNSSIAEVNEGTVTAKAEGTAIITVTTQDGGKTATCTLTVLSSVVINGIRWATRNVNKPGTFATKPENAGMFYQWNRKIGWSSTNPLVNSDGGTTWNSTNAQGTTWEPVNDPCPTGWRVPTHEELESLAAADNYWGKLNGVSGRFFGSDENPLFLPAAGFRFNAFGAALTNVGTNGLYWSSTPNGTTSAYYLGFKSNNEDPYFAGIRADAFCIRCVAAE